MNARSPLISKAWGERLPRASTVGLCSQRRPDRTAVDMNAARQHAGRAAPPPKVLADESGWSGTIAP